MSPDARPAVAENRAWPDRAIAELAARQATIVSHAQLAALGVRPSLITAALARGRLHPVHHGVHSLVPAAARPSHASEHAALLACGPRAVLSHETAARLHGLRLPGHVGTSRGRGRPGLSVHRTRVLGRAERVRIGGLPVTSIARTIIDLAASWDDRSIERLVDQALKKTSRAKLVAALERHAGRAGAPRVRAALTPGRPSSDTWSHPEERLLQLIRRAGLPVPEANVALGNEHGFGHTVPDLRWPEHRVIVEYDSWDHHSGQAAFHADRARHNRLTAGGWQVIHVTWPQLTQRPERVLVWIAAALARGGWRGAP
jgi:very-short-patch-repair endonuclease